MHASQVQSRLHDAECDIRDNKRESRITASDGDASQHRAIVDDAEGTTLVDKYTYARAEACTRREAGVQKTVVVHCRRGCNAECIDALRKHTGGVLQLGTHGVVGVEIRVR